MRKSHSPPYVESVFLDDLHINTAHAVDPGIAHTVQPFQKSFAIAAGSPCTSISTLPSHSFFTQPVSPKTGSHPSGSGTKAYSLDISIEIKMLPYFLHIDLPPDKTKPAAGCGNSFYIIINIFKTSKTISRVMSLDGHLSRPAVASRFKRPT